MTDNDYLSLIDQGVEAWNRWREEHPEIKPDLSRAYLFEAELSGFNFSDVNFSRVCLIGANLKRANLSSADLNGAYAGGANLSEANLKGANLSSANLSEANFTGADLTAAKAEATDLTAAQMTGACLENWQISKATKLHRIEAQYVYLNRQQRHFPSEGNFKPGELAALLQAESDRSPLQKPVASAWVSPQVPDSAESNAAPVASPPEATTETAVLQSAAPGRSRSVPWEILVGVGVGLAVIAAIASFPRTRTVTELPPLVCNEPPLPPISDSPPAHEYADGTRFYGTFGESAP
ncbi:MAG: hypothetical protein HC840_09060 [Leptolyngbyaceae cyanobacterium RM2_2_4]|nr:hypothetical protein [Leptolyngbyaceae cyanobacterium RM2_2_4]